MAGEGCFLDAVRSRKSLHRNTTAVCPPELGSGPTHYLEQKPLQYLSRGGFLPGRGEADQLKHVVNVQEEPALWNVPIKTHSELVGVCL